MKIKYNHLSCATRRNIVHGFQINLIYVIKVKTRYNFNRVKMFTFSSLRLHRAFT